jgi:carboxyl-terminal processing protease
VSSLVCFRLALTLIFILSGSGPALGQTSFRNDLSQLEKLLSEHHVQPRPVDDSLSCDVVQSLLRMIDPDKLYYTQAEVSRIIACQSKLTSDIISNTWTFLPLFEETTRLSLTRARKTILATTQQPVNLNAKETVSLDTMWAADEASLKEKITFAVKLNTLRQLNRYGATDETQNIEKCRRVVEAAMLRAVDKLLQQYLGFGHVAGNIFLKAYLRAHDPHSVYFSPIEMQNFVASLSSQGFHFGFVLEENLKGNVIIRSLVPGSPAWKSGEIYTGDIIDGMAWHGKPKIDAALLSIEEIEAVLMESNDEVLDLYLRTSDGSIKQVMLKKALQSAGDDIVRSSVLIADSKIGYISLPDFYSNWEQEGGAEAANDVAKAIIKLKKENIKGLILDLRFNGGGSLKEAVAMAGIFIDAGPMGLLRGKTGDAVTYKDFNRGTVWDGPLVVMVNGLSASASEFLGAALQDYNRALVVGSRTYGKGTAQNIFSLEAGKPTLNLATVGKSTKTGYATITTERCYRISGKSVQYAGLIPDITIPDLHDYTSYQESQLPFALKPDVIFKKVYYQPLPQIPLSALGTSSRERIASNSYFNEIAKMKALLDEDSNRQTSISLSKADFELRFQALNRSVEALERMSSTETGIFKVEFLPSDSERMSVDEYFKQLNTSWSSMLKTDHTLGETVNILTDFIKQSKNP